LTRLSTIHVEPIASIASAVLSVETNGEGFFEITRDAVAFLERIRAHDGVLLLFLRHTSASLVIQENADPDVQTDLVTALKRLAPADAGWAHEVEGPDDMPAHIKAMLTGACLHIPVAGGKMQFGTWQAYTSPSIACAPIPAKSCCNSLAPACRPRRDDF
jgi:secondary thiamine-phosphate synthase enzyme